MDKLESEDYDDELKSFLHLNSESEHHGFKSKKDILTEIKSIRNTISSLNNEITKVENLRNKLYAHSDPNENPENISIEELEKLVLVARAISNSFSSKLFGNTLLLERVYDWDVGGIIHQLDNCKQKHIKSGNLKP